MSRDHYEQDETVSRGTAIHMLRMAYMTGRDATRKPIIIRKLLALGDVAWVDDNAPTSGEACRGIAAATQREEG